LPVPRTRLARLSGSRHTVRAQQSGTRPPGKAVPWQIGAGHALTYPFVLAS